MRQLADAERIRRFMAALGTQATQQRRIYFTGGASAVLIGWRRTTIDVDLKIVPEDDDLLRSIPSLKESLHINVELASPDQFIPPLLGWEGRSLFIASEGALSFYHYDLYAQALAKIERNHRQDLEDVRQMLHRALIAPELLLEHYRRIEPELYRYPAVNGASFRRSLEDVVREWKAS